MRRMRRRVSCVASPALHDYRGSSRSGVGPRREARRIDQCAANEFSIDLPCDSAHRRSAGRCESGCVMFIPHFMQTSPPLLEETRSVVHFNRLTGGGATFTNLSTRSCEYRGECRGD